MNKEEVIAVAVRIFAVAMAVYALKNLPGMIFYIDQEEMQGAVYLFLSVLAATLLLALILWKFPLTIAHKIIPRSKEPVEVSKWSNRDALTCGFVLLGVYFSFHVVSDAIYWLFYWINIPSYEGMEINWSIDQVAQIYATAAEFVVVVVLILGARGMANLVVKMRDLGIESIEANQQADNKITKK